MTDFHNKWREFLAEAKKDAKILRNINIDQFKKEVPKNPDEETRDYFARLQAMEADPEQSNPVFPHELVSWMESLPDNHFPSKNRKMFAKWLANSIYYEETDGKHRPVATSAFENLTTYNNDVRIITDYLNAAANLPKELWSLGFYQLHDLSLEWHERLAAGVVGKEELPAGKLNYIGKKVVYKFKNGYSIVEVDPTAGEREYTKEEGLRCGWAHNYDELQEFHAYFDEKGVDPSERPEFSIRDKINDLDIEGCAMGHCVGGYCDTVTKGNMTIYSLRSPGNKPHATIDVVNSNKKVYQIKGNQNEVPIEKYRPMIKQWLQSSGLDYENSTDYLNILSIEEVNRLFREGKLSTEQSLELARHSDNQEALSFILDKIEDKLDMEDDPEPLGRDMKRKFIDVMCRNKNMNEDIRIRLLKVALPLDTLGVRVKEVLVSDPFPPARPAHIDSAKLATAAWSELSSDLTTGKIGEEKMYYMQAFMEGKDTDQNIKEQIIEHILSDEFLKRNLNRYSMNNSGPQVIRRFGMPFGHIVQAYLKSKGAKEEQVTKIYDLQRDKVFKVTYGESRGLNSYIAGSAAMSDELVDKIIRDVEDNRYMQMSRNNIVDIISNRGVSDSSKIKLLNVEDRDNQSIRSQTAATDAFSSSKGSSGVVFNPRGKMLARALKQAADDGNISVEVSKYLVDEGILDSVFAKELEGKYRKKTGKDPMFQTKSGKEKEKVLRDIRNLALQWLGQQKKLVRLGGPEIFDIMEEVDKYFGKNIMTKDKFYDTIKEQLNIKEEKGRSRQRGIYKFHCMISYSLTVEYEKTRGLDDILADLRALPNVTIVTVAIRNKKIGERRYIAGLAIKFIPSVPGEFNAPEDVKARIIKDIKRLSNVESMFKVSTGLQRLE